MKGHKYSRSVMRFSQQCRSCGNDRLSPIRVRKSHSAFICLKNVVVSTAFNE